MPAADQPNDPSAKPSVRRKRSPEVPAESEGHIAAALDAQDHLQHATMSLTLSRHRRAAAIKLVLDAGAPQRMLAAAMFGGPQMQPWVRLQAQLAGKGGWVAGDVPPADHAEMIVWLGGFNRAVAAASIEECRWRNVRSIEVWRAVRAGAGPSTVARRLGSASPASVLGMLVAPTPETADVVIEGDLAAVSVEAARLADDGHQVWVELRGGGAAVVWCRLDPRQDEDGFAVVRASRVFADYD